MIGYLGLGSNVGNRRSRLQGACHALDGAEIRVLASSSVYETEPVGEVLDQRDFLNACLRISTALGPEELLDACKGVERDLGRARGGQRHGPRAIDVDVLALGDRVHASTSLRVPHPGLLTRRFVIVPLLELDPSLSVEGVALSDALAELGPGQDVRRAGEPLMLTRG